jgi:hypothetical protein
MKKDDRQMGKTVGSEKESFQQKVFSLSAGHAGHNRTLALDSSILKFSGDLNSGVFLSQLIYWCDKGKSSDGYVYKTYKDWSDEILLSEYEIKKACEKFKSMGILDVKVRKANGSPTCHYKLDQQAFINAFLNFFEKETENIKNGYLNNKDSLTNITAESSSKITKKYNGAKSKDVRPMCFSFKELTEDYNIEKEKAQGISYYMSSYKHLIGKEHPRLSIEQWTRVIASLFNCKDTNRETYHEIDLEALESMIDQHFKTKYQDCDYNILHFISDGVKVRRMYEVAY